MLGTLIGWKVAGWTGAIVATLALYLPFSLLCFGVLKATNAHRDKKWHRAALEGLAPVGTGPVIAGVIAIFRLSGGLLGASIAGASATIFLLALRFPTLAVLGSVQRRRSWFISWHRTSDRISARRPKWRPDLSPNKINILRLRDC